MQPDPKNFVNSIAKAFAVLKAFDATLPELTITEIANRAELDRGTSFRLVHTLCQLGYLAAVLIREQGDPLAFAVIGDGFVNGQPLDYLGYDGQFAYWIARDPTPAVTGAYLDVPAYRYQRILYPLLAWALAAGQAALVPWTLVAVNLAAQLAGTWLVPR